MVFFSKLDRSADLVKGMADRTGLDLSDPSQVAQFKQMVYACAGCEEQGACQRLQDENVQLDAPPIYCRNAGRFAAE